MAIAAITSSLRTSFALMRSPTWVGFSGTVAPSWHVIRQSRDPLDDLLQQVAPVVRRHFADDLRRERNALPEPVASGSLGEVATIQDDQVAVDQVGGDRVRDGVLKRLVEGFSGGMRAMATLHVGPQHHVEAQHQGHLVRRRLAVRSRPGLCGAEQQADRVLQRR